jgi:hypothetical protein
VQHAFVDAGIRQQESDRTAFVALPGGIGTLDEIFEVGRVVLGAGWRVVLGGGSAGGGGTSAVQRGQQAGAPAGPLPEPHRGAPGGAQCPAPGAAAACCR